MQNIIASLALLKANLDNEKDYIEIFVPFVITLIKKNDYSKIDLGQICIDFSEEYHFSIPLQPMKAILERTRKRGYIAYKKGVGFIPRRKRIGKHEFSKRSIEQLRKYNRVIQAFKDFCKTEYDQDISDTDANKIIIAFLKDHELDILFASRSMDTILPEAYSTASERFLIYKFIVYTHQAAPDLFSFIVDITIALIFSETVFYGNVEKFKGSIQGQNYYLDTSILFNVIGINGEIMESAYNDFINLLTSHDVNLWVFKHTYNEFLGILEGCLTWIDHSSFDPKKAGHALRYFRERNYSKSDILEIIHNTDPILEKLNIQVINAPAPQEYKTHQIDEEALTKVIIDVYKSNDPSFDAIEKEDTIYRDIRSISSIHRLRRGKKPKTLQDANHIFITTNSSLAYASKVFENKFMGTEYFYIPTTLTDTFTGTLIWIRSPLNIAETINEKKLLANCYSALQPSDRLISMLIDKAEKLEKSGEINEDQLIILKESPVARNLLQEETLGDPERFTDRTVHEILHDMTLSIRKEAEEVYEEDRLRLLRTIEKISAEKDSADEKRSKTETLLEISEDEKAALENKVLDFARRRAQIYGWILYTFAAIVLLIALLTGYCAIIDCPFMTRSIYIVVITITVIVGFFTSVTSFNFWGAKDFFVKKIEEKFINKFIED